MPFSDRGKGGGDHEQGKIVHPQRVVMMVGRNKLDEKLLTRLPLVDAGAICKVANACISVIVEAGSIYFSPKLD